MGRNRISSALQTLSSQAKVSLNLAPYRVSFPHPESPSHKKTPLGKWREVAEGTVVAGNSSHSVCELANSPTTDSHKEEGTGAGQREGSAGTLLRNRSFRAPGTAEGSSAGKGVGGIPRGQIRQGKLAWISFTLLFPSLRTCSFFLLLLPSKTHLSLIIFNQIMGRPVSQRLWIDFWFHGVNIRNPIRMLVRSV